MQRADSGIVDRAYNHEQLHLLLDENTDTVLHYKVMASRQWLCEERGVAFVWKRVCCTGRINALACIACTAASSACYEL